MFFSAFAAFQPNLMTYGDRKVVMMIIVLTIGRMNALVAPTSAPPLAVTRASSLAIACDLDSATSTPAKKAPAATENPM